VNNSLVHESDSKIPFIPQKGNKVGWYICGPTVYDSSHMGHARNYVTFDIIRRILEDYFHYQVFSVMNITDVDDKIILKARRTHLFEKYIHENKNFSEKLKQDVLESWKNYINGLKTKLQELINENQKLTKEKASEKKLLEEKLAIASDTLAKLSKNLEKGSQLSEEELKEIFQKSKDPLSILLDDRLGSTVTDTKIFRETASVYEAEFLEDMKRLGVRPPDILTRVTEYIPEIINYVSTIIQNGFGYVSNGSVYFDTTKFTQSHTYGKLSPSSIGDPKLFEEGEGSLSKALGAEKRNANDFALWKRSKPGEPSWNSPWGLGRPGWHIECSAMASDLLGEILDIHFGGEDLRFPHHDNELAQAEAYYGHQQWVNYFLHSGHLHIDGLKMSKSLKNFITIREALEKYTPRQLRLLFLTRPWDRVMNYQEDTMKEVKAKEKTIQEFFLNVKNIVKDGVSGQNVVTQKWDEKEKALHDNLERTKLRVDDALKNNFDTPSAMDHLLQLINETNIYNSQKDRRIFLIRRIAAYITSILKVFGVVPHDEFGLIGDSGGEEGLGVSSRETVLKPYLDVLSQFRSEVRQIAIETKSKQLLALTDRLRDELCPPLGLRLEDESDGYKLVDPKELQREMEQAKQNAQGEAIKKLKTRIASKQGEYEKLLQSQVPPSEMFSKEEYSAFDANGIPTHTKDGKEVSTKLLKKLQKDKEKREKDHQAYLTKLKEDPHFPSKLSQEISQLQAQLQKLTGEDTLSSNGKSTVKSRKGQDVNKN